MSITDKDHLIYARIFVIITIESLSVTFVRNFDRGCPKQRRQFLKALRYVDGGWRHHRRWRKAATKEPRSTKRNIIPAGRNPSTNIYYAGHVKAAGWMRKQWRIFLKLTSHTRITRPILIYRGLLSPPFYLWGKSSSPVSVVISVKMRENIVKSASSCDDINMCDMRVLKLLMS